MARINITIPHIYYKEILIYSIIVYLSQYLEGRVTIDKVEEISIKVPVSFGGKNLWEAGLYKNGR